MTDPGGGVDPELLRQAREVVARRNPSLSEPAPPAIFEFNRAAVLTQQGRAAEGMEIYRRLALSPVNRVPPRIGADSAKHWAEDSFRKREWDEVIQAERAAGPHLDALRSSSADLFVRDACSSERGRLATYAAFAWAQRNSTTSARAVLESGRNTMLAERLAVGLPASPVDPPEPGAPAGAASPPTGDVVYLLATSAGGVAVPEGNADPVWLDQLGGDQLEERWNAYGSALDALRRNSLLGMKTWVVEVAAMVAYLEDALAPLFAEFAGADLTLVPTGVLSLLPIGAAALGPGRQPPERGVTVVPSRRLGGGGRDEHAHRVLTVFDPALPASLSECTGVNAFFHESGSAPIGSTASQILSAVPAGGVVHFACHARAESGTPLRNAIILPGGDQITVAGILDTGTHSPAARLVVLSACESGLAGPYVIDETISLPAAFLAAGYGGVLSTLWEVEDASTALLMLQFYWQWRHEEHFPSLALARAQHWQRHSTDVEKCGFVEDTLVTAGILDPSVAATLAQQIRERSTGLTVNSYSEPYYWAGFSFSGR